MEPLELAIKLEMEGKAFYQAASEKSGDELGKALFARLAKEEDFHAAKAREIAEFLKRGETPLAIEESLDNGKRLDAIFAKARKGSASKRKAGSPELEAVKVALDLEEKSRKFYEEHGATAKTDFERRFFKALKGEERGHYLSLIDYREYLTDPVGWFTRTERHSMDGG
ncbi:MAG: hypothetical protein FJZ95_08970 [Chloroflexi bacterium]|nr:hypothetical protein [Chloroflexota bacterium]